MISLNSSTGFVRVLQVLLSIISIGINSKSILTNESISAITDSITSSNSINSTDTLSFNSSSTPELISLVSSSLTTVSHTYYSGIAPNLLSIGQSGLFSSPKLITGFASSLSSIGQLTYTTGLSSSELSQLALWFTSFSYQLSEYGSWDCSSSIDLYDQYNITNSIDLIQLNDWNGVNYTDYLINTNDSNQLLNQLRNLTYYNYNISLINYNQTNEILNNDLLLSLSNDCNLKKASIAINLLGLLSFFISSGSVLTSAINLFNSSNKASLTKANEDTYSIVSTFAHLKKPVPNELNEIISINQENNTVIELNSNLSDNLTLSTVTELENFQSNEEPLFRLKFSRAILFPSLEKN